MTQPQHFIPFSNLIMPWMDWIGFIRQLVSKMQIKSEMTKK
jgi:hypothetical protein